MPAINTSPPAAFLSASVNADEVKKFAAVGQDWWSSASSSGTGPLHAMNPVRVAYIREALAAQLSTSHLPPDAQLRGAELLDVGCGGGILSEALARLGARVTSIDPSGENVAVARAHSAADPATAHIDYRQTTVEEVAASGRTFDAVCALEVIEHVETPMAFITACATCVRPGGSLFLSTINRTAKSYAVAIVGAEYVARVVPAGTHDWNKFITPEELRLMAEAHPARLTVVNKQGLVMRVDPFATGKLAWGLNPSDLDVNYIMQAVKAGKLRE
jgi:SAM-dependent methyltransferase